MSPICCVIDSFLTHKSPRCPYETRRCVHKRHFVLRSSLLGWLRSTGSLNAQLGNNPYWKERARGDDEGGAGRRFSTWVVERRAAQSRARQGRAGQGGARGGRATRSTAGDNGVAGCGLLAAGCWLRIAGTGAGLGYRATGSRARRGGAQAAMLKGCGQVKSRINPQAQSRTPSRDQAGTIKPVRRAGWEWAASFAPAAKSCVGWVYVRRCAHKHFFSFYVARASSVLPPSRSTTRRDASKCNTGSR